MLNKDDVEKVWETTCHLILLDRFANSDIKVGDSSNTLLYRNDRQYLFETRLPKAYYLTSFLLSVGIGIGCGRLHNSMKTVLVTYK